MLRLAVLASHPIQYQAPLYRALASSGRVALKVFFCWDFGIREEHDPGFGRAIRWDVPLLDGYDHELLPNYARRPTTERLFGLLNPTAPLRIAAFRPDALVVHGYNHFASLWSLFTGRLRGLPVLLRGETCLLRHRSPTTLAAKRAILPPLLRAYSGFLTIGSLNAAYYRHYGVPDERLFLAPYSVDNDFFQRRAAGAREEARRWRAELDIPEDHLVAGFAAKLIGVKGCGDLVAAFRRAAVPNSSLVIVGDGELRGELEQAAGDALGRTIHFTGFVNQSRMAAAYALADLHVLPSHSEQWGLAVNEAMNLGLPIVASSQVGAGPDLVGPDNGWIFPAGDIEALARILSEALSDRAGLERRGRASLERISSWGIDETMAGYLRAVEAVTCTRS